MYFLIMHQDWYAKLVLPNFCIWHILHLDYLSLSDIVLSGILYCYPINMDWKTDVLGVYDRPPVEPNAVLLREIGEHLL